MEDRPTIQWFPGHMKKTERLIEKNIYLVDIVIEVADARVPLSSRNPNLGYLIKNKPRLLLLNKNDLANAQTTALWLEYFKSKHVSALAVDCKSGSGMKAVVPSVKNILQDVIAKRKEKGQTGRSIRMMVVGIPNVGKSSFINRMAGSKRAKVEDRPGVTRGKQWVTIDQNIELLDMPGVLWPKFEDPSVGEYLSFTGAVKDNVLDTEWLAMRLLALLSRSYPQLLKERYKLEYDKDVEDYDRLVLLGKKRGMLISGGEVDTERAASMLLDEYRGGKIGRISLESPDDLLEKTNASES